MIVLKTESQKHRNLTDELIAKMKSIGLTIEYIDREGYKKPPVVENDSNVGDGKDKIPDIQAAKPDGSVVRGEAKCGEGDIETMHSITQYLLFSNRAKGNLPSHLLLIVPQSKQAFAEAILDKYLKEWQRARVIVVGSDKY